MAYTINLTDGSIFATIADGTINTSSSMTLVGKNYAGYGEFLDENFIHLLENSSNTSAPGAPLTGQLWWDKTNGLMKVYNGAAWKTISASTASSSTPSSNVAGDLWFDTTNQQLKVYNGATWILVGPSSTSGQGTSGAIVTTIQDILSAQHVIVQMYVNNTIVAIISKDATFTPLVPIAGFSTISPGIQLSTTVSGALFQGTAVDSNKLGGVLASGYLQNTGAQSMSGTLVIANDGGLKIGADSDANISVTGSGVVNISNDTNSQNMLFRVNVGGVPTTAMTIYGANGAVGVSGNISASYILGNGSQLTGIDATSISSGTSNVKVASTNGNVTVNIGGTSNVAVFSSTAMAIGNIINSNANGVGNIGSSTTYFNTIFAKATSAQYADVAERFAADEFLAPGTVVELGGVAEITRAIEELSDRVFGVVSTNAAYLMNAGAGPDETHPPVAMTGRVPVRVIGSVKKGDRLVSAGNGLARSAAPGEATSFNVIGRALDTKSDSSEGMIEAIVTIK